MTQKAEMLAELRQRHEANLAAAIPEVLALARVLQLAAFTPAEAGERGFVGEFAPAPVYLQQATTFANNRGLFSALAATCSEVCLAQIMHAEKERTK